ncbi:GNAT family N-acetyltransferase [Nocardia sp. NPDC057227]|uniref:GNAT family N-acetyltransferase n=1 Tax=Nocardia sp. NPDC057227 TaxID=3346056 RepID=UPI00363B22B1
MLIRGVRSGDVAAIAALHAASWRTAYAGMMPSEFLDGDLLADRLAVWRERCAAAVPPGLFVAEDGGELLGFGYATPTPDGRVLLDNLHAAPGRTRAGIGTRLLGTVFDWAATTHPDRGVHLEVLQANTPAIAFYERHGGTRIDTRTAHFEQGFDLPEFEYSWPAGFRLH